LLEKQARAYAESVALYAPGQKALSYHMLWQQAQYAAHVLRLEGITPDSRVAVILPNGPDLATAFLAVAACAVCAPLNPAYTAAELRFYLRDLGVQAAVLRKMAVGPERAVAEELGIKTLEIETTAAHMAGQFQFANYPRRDALDPEFLLSQGTALVLHTSGTTSRPKIVPLSQSNLLASAQNIASTLKLSQADRCLNVMPLFHIHGLAGALLGSLISGGSVVCTPGYHEENFTDWIAEYAPTWYTASPTIHQSFVEQGAQYRLKAPEHQFRFVRSASAALSPTTYFQLGALIDAPVIETYGLTESTSQMTSNPLPPGIRKAGSVGMRAGAEVELMDESGNILKPGEIGEIVVRGAGVTAGYENNVDANATAFSGGWLRTGDQGRFDADDYLFITGRLKEIINRGGEKISPREIDEALLTHVGVANAAAFAVPHPSLGEDVAAAVVLRPGATVDETGLRGFLFGFLADFKVPSTIVIADAIPKGSTGKIQRSGLHKHFGNLLSKAYVAAFTPTEQILTAIFQEVLARTRVGVQDNFFALGGDSLQGAQVIALVNSRFQTDLPVITLFRCPAVGLLASEIDATVARNEAVLNELASEIGAMSDEEVARHLQDEPKA
jgi:acyl-CoA synthetase (AMP-forming)/AMP-acid ligase II